MRLLFPPLVALLAWLLLGSSGSAQTLTVFAAASLTDTFGEIGAAFEAGRPGVRVAFNFAGSSTLAFQILQGAPADLLASADEQQLERVAAEGLLAGPGRAFAGNELVLLAATGSGIDNAAALAAPGTLLVLAAPEVPAGRYARAWLAGADEAFGPGYGEAVLANLVSNEPNVRQAAAKVALGEADAALVYRSDTLGLNGVTVVALPGGDDIGIRYWVASLRRSAQTELAEAFIAFVLSDAGRKALARHGFDPPP